MKLFNTYSRKTEELVPAKGKQISLYACGLTVYSQPHIGNWVAYIYWDILVRSLRAQDYDVNHVQNITDVGHLTSDEDAGEDKMLKSALKEGTTAWDVAEKYISIADHEAFNLLALQRPTHMPRATDYIRQQIKFVQKLEEMGYTYTIADGVYFDTSKLDDYGKLARLDIKGLRFGARVEDTGKKNPTDFAVWKFSDPAEKRDMEWESPWGKGFPGWHLECSVMARELLGDTLDIHTGGIDHIPIHHTNEIAQSETVTGKPLASIWVHANHMKVNGTKMSKSLGNIFTLDDIQKKGFDLMAFKLLVLSKHYRTEGNFTWKILEAAQNRLKSLYMLADLQFQEDNEHSTNLGKDYFDGLQNDILSALNDDLNTPEVIRILSEVTDHVFAQGRGIGSNDIGKFKEFLGFVDDILGLNLAKRRDITDKQRVLLWSEREAARKQNDWETSDKIRKQLEEQGIGINDTPGGPIWYRI